MEVKIVIYGVDYDIHPKSKLPLSQQPKEDKRDWEITAIYDDLQTVEGENIVYIPHGAKIKSVKRLSDNVVFSVGDKVLDKDSITNNECEIRSFEIVGEGINILCHFTTSSYLEDRFLYQIKHHSPQPILKQEPLFTTEDGVGIPQGYTGDLWRVFTEPSSYEMWTPHNLGMPQYKNKGEKYFKDLVAAGQYILENKPCLSLNDLLEVWGDIDSTIPTVKESQKRSSMYKRFEQLAKNKIK